jgi:2-polyprenyl-3-methyl-5-hydroxy-6-metoxy-1,4-benzoquinol methylase
MLCGTPVVSVDYGAMTETITEGVMGYRCHTLQDWIDGINAVGDLDRRIIADTARAKWSLEACGARYDKIFRQLNDLYRKGWYEVDQISYQQIESEEGPFATRLAEWVANTLNPATALDLGCGPGTYVNALRGHGIDAAGIDTDERVKGKPYLTQQSMFDLTEIADVVLCLEVAEHLPEADADAVAVTVACAIADGGTLIWSAAKPGQGGVGHINCQDKAYWQQRLEAQGLTRMMQLEGEMLLHIGQGYHMGWFLQNAMVFSPAGANLKCHPA